MVLRYVGPDYTFEQQRVVINEIAVDVDNLSNAGYATTELLDSVVSSIPTFDQDLSTVNDVTFNRVGITTGEINVGYNNSLLINVDDAESGVSTYTFDTVGNLTLPGNIYIHGNSGYVLFNNGGSKLQAEPNNDFEIHVGGFNNKVTGFGTDGSLSVPGDIIVSSGSVGIGTTNPTSALTVQGDVKVSGNLNAPGNYYVKVARTTDQTALNGADTLLGFSVISDPNNWYSGITTRTTPTVAGTYHVDLMVNWYEGTITNNQTNIQLRKNGSTFAISLVGIHTFSYTQNACGIVTMNGTTDYIDATVYTSNPTSQDIRGTADGSWTKMEVFKIN